MGENLDINNLTVTVGGLATIGVLSATRFMVNWIRELIEPESDVAVRWIVTAVSFFNITMFGLNAMNPSIGGVEVGAYAGSAMILLYLTAVTAYTVNALHIKERVDAIRHSP